MIVPGILVCSSFLISVCMFIASIALFISSATVIVRAGGTIWLNPFATVFFNVCSALTVGCCVLYPCCVIINNIWSLILVKSNQYYVHCCSFMDPLHGGYIRMVLIRV